MVFPETAPMSVQITTTELTAVERVQKDEKEEKDEQAPAVQETPDTETPMPAGQAMDGGGTERLPDPARKARYDREYRRFLAMVRAA